MKKIIFVLLLSTVVISCKSYFFNGKLEKMGAFNSHIHLTKLVNNSKDVVFFPMIHLATEEFYNDTKKKIDSLKKLDYYFFYENLKVSPGDTTTLRKFRKITGAPIPKLGLGYMYLVDSVYKYKPKKKIIGQPTYAKLGIDSISGKRVDLDLKDIITAYESNYGEIKLELCDFKSSYYEKSTCYDKVISENILKSLKLTLRNQKIVNEVLVNKRKKIALIYGVKHFIEIKKTLLDSGFKYSK